jgi:hypothetical protein
MEELCIIKFFDSEPDINTALTKGNFEIRAE